VDNNQKLSKEHNTSEPGNYVTCTSWLTLDQLDVACALTTAIKSVNDAFTRYTKVIPPPFIPTPSVISIPDQYIMSKMAGYKWIYTLPLIDLTTIIHH
jgi:hypothetical protein